MGFGHTPENILVSAFGSQYVVEAVLAEGLSRPPFLPPCSMDNNPISSSVPTATRNMVLLARVLVTWSQHLMWASLRKKRVYLKRYDPRQWDFCRPASPSQDYWSGLGWGLVVLWWEVKVSEVNMGQAEEKGSLCTQVPSFHLQPRTVPYTSCPPTLSRKISWPRNQSHLS